MVPSGSTESLSTASALTAAWQFASALVVTSRHRAIGDMFTAVFTVTVNEQTCVLPDASVAVQITVVVPGGKTEPDDGSQLAVAPGQLSVTDGSTKFTLALVWPGGASVTMSAGQTR